MSDTKNYMGIELGATSLKIALMDPAEKRVLKTAAIPMPTNPMNDIYTLEVSLQQWMEDNQIEGVEAVSVTVPAIHSVIRQVYVPAEAASRMNEYLQWYLGMITNADKNAYIVDYQVLGGSDNVGYTVLLMAVRRPWVDGLRKGFRMKALTPRSMEVDVLSLMNLMDAAENIQQLECIIKADYIGVVLMWMTKDNLQGLRCVSTLPLVDKSAEEAFSMLADEIIHQMQLAKDENATLDVKHLHLCGELALSQEFVEALRAKAGDYQLVLMDSFTNLRLPVEAADAENVLVCTGAIGAALNLMEGA
ncbi:MAG: hypothetical protein MJY99_07600 [Fibrobacter sp.]|uniref:type IV pilus biogenesis protein PilM n=1 Tax=Fibrobacter sp. TaxID=35828 RepID=UPI00388ECFE2|nr:hypothetical protein [Fibrobacter sp.]